jgi:hypothetical protein
MFGWTRSIRWPLDPILCGNSFRPAPEILSKNDRTQLEQRRNETVRLLLQEASQHCEIAVLGEFDEPEWVVEPRDPH